MKNAMRMTVLTIGMATGMAMFAVAEVPSGDVFGCKRIALDEKGKSASLSVQGVDFSASPQFEMDAFAEDLSSLDGAIYLALIDGKGLKRTWPGNLGKGEPCPDTK